MKYELYEVGGRIRDFYLGLESKDVDYSVVVEESWRYHSPLFAFNSFRDDLIQQGYKIFLETPESFTIRAMFPEDHKFSGVADFVLARKETSYIEGTRQPVVSLGSLEDDLLRRDFTVNSMARTSEGVIIDPFGGIEDLLNRVLRTPKDSTTSFSDDPLRIIRALRFHITKGLGMSDDVANAITLFEPKLMSVVSEDRIREEFVKMFKYDTKRTLQTLRWLQRENSGLYEVIVDSFWLLPTNKSK